jgi:hypothetical protein
MFDVCLWRFHLTAFNALLGTTAVRISFKEPSGFRLSISCLFRNFRMLRITGHLVGPGQLIRFYKLYLNIDLCVIVLCPPDLRYKQMIIFVITIYQQAKQPILHKKLPHFIFSWLNIKPRLRINNTLA